ncbi:hypothetical protein D3C72_1636130 [compost metagenome]
MLAAGDQGREALIEGLELLVDASRGNSHHHLADFCTVGVDRGFDEVHRRVAPGRIDHLVQGAFALALLHQRLVDRVLPVQVAGQVLALGIVIDHEQHVGVALGTSGEVG